MFSLWCTTILLVIVVDAGRNDWSIEKNAAFWNEQARLTIEEMVQREENSRVAKNVIMFLGDGMGVPTVTAGRIRKGQTKGLLAEDFLTEMEQFPYVGLAKTYVYRFIVSISIDCLDTISIIKHQIQQPQPLLISVELKHN